MSVKRYSVGYKDSASGRYAAMLDKPDGGYVSHEDYAALELKLAESQREFRAADATIENMQMQLNAEREAKLALAAKNTGLASLEAESVAFRSKLKPPSSIGREHWDYTDHRQPDAFELESCVIERLFTEPPAPVAVPDELEKAQRMESYWKTQCRGITDHCEELQSRVAELSSHKAALLKFIRDSCYVFDGADEDISDAYVDAITSGIMPKLEAVAACNPPLFWVRVKSDGGYDGPIHDSKLEDVRKKSGEWLPLTLACVDASRQPSEVSCRAAMLKGAEPVTTANKLRDAVETIRNSGIEIDAEKIFAERDALNAPDCWCRTCRPITLTDMRFVVCPDCGNKRCPHANDHRNACTGSNEPGQEGSAYPAAPQQEAR
ncbi:hypothetical protein QM128_05690 [Enterobacter hormaechei]|uniref:hypothetical protein n=1 Tax=Enterobacter hormaechei TaxID=158836 RepID=UPI00294A07C1|nr:hypothetical protein [Enterobacter hormaechei]MDV5581931.1 hypothetical protein [Enterobacter hormaechei]